MTPKTGVLAVLLGAIGLTVMAEPAMGLVPIDTRTTILVTSESATTAQYAGFVTTKLKKGKPDRESKKAATDCLRGRTVSIDYLGRELGSTVTNRKGLWSITGPKPPPGGAVQVLVSRDVRRDVLCGVLSKFSQPVF